jgi:hypothetical protein
MFQLLKIHCLEGHFHYLDARLREFIRIIILITNKLVSSSRALVVWCSIMVGELPVAAVVPVTVAVEAPLEAILFKTGFVRASDRAGWRTVEG